jgi:hypothetical protein
MAFLHDYLEYASGNEAPEMFHVWGGYTALSVAISRRVWLPFEDTAIFPNIYVMFVGPAGNGKTWAMRKVKRVLAELPDVPISGSVETPPGLWRFMMGNPKADPPLPSPVAFPARWPDGIVREVHPMTIVANEFINFISIDANGWINALNDIYDEDLYRYRTKNMGEDVLIGPYIVLLGALTNEVASDLQKARIISTGLARRTLFQYGERRWDDPHPKPTFDAHQKAARDRCVTHLKQLQKTGGAFAWSDEVDVWWTEWYKSYLVEVPKQPPALQSWFASKSIQVLKLGMLTCLSEDFNLKLKIKHFETTLEFLAILEHELIRIFGGVGRNELAAVALKIGEFIEARDIPVSKRDLKINFFTLCRPPNEFEDCLQFLIDSKRVIKADMFLGGGSAYQDSVYATPAVMDKFAAAVRAKGGSLVGVAQPDSTPDSVALADQSPLPSINPWVTIPLTQVVAEHSDESSVGPPLMVDQPEED